MRHRANHAEGRRLLRALKVIRVGTLCITGFESKRLLTRVLDELNPVPGGLVAEQRQVDKLAADSLVGMNSQRVGAFL